MDRYCEVCGRKLTTSLGPIGPVCLKKLTTKNIQQKSGMSKDDYVKQLEENDIFRENITNEEG
jgi:hypothetical protein